MVWGRLSQEDFDAVVNIVLTHMRFVDVQGIIRLYGRLWSIERLWIEEEADGN